MADDPRMIHLILMGKQYSVGDTVQYLTFGGKTRTVVVESRSGDIKDGKPGFDSTDGNWGYDDQIVRVVKG